MDGVHPPCRCVLLWNGGGACCCQSARSVRVVCALPIPVQYSSVLRLCCVLFVAGVWCVAVCVCLCCSFGGVSFVRSPFVVVVGGGIVDGGVCVVVVGGMALKGGCCDAVPPV